MSDNNQYIVSARKYRPGTFSSVVGQKTLTSTLSGAIHSGRLAQAYLFCGPRGVGKTSCARIFAKTINCLHPGPDGEACGECESCKAIARGNSFNLIELDAASNNSVEDIRNLIEQVNVPPQLGKYKVFIIDEVHMLSSQAFNAFLKTLEEPPAYAIFILATTEKQKVIPTILSRCQIYDFKRITVEDMVEHLSHVAQSEGITADPKALGVIARKADGAMRDALSIFDQVSASSGGNITYESAVENLNVLDYDYYFRLVDAFRRSDVPESLLIYKEIRDKGFDSLFFINGLSQHVRDLMVAADPRTLSLLEVDSDTAKKYGEQASSLPLQWYYAAMKVLNNADYSYRTASNKQLLVEVALIRLCQLLKPATPPFDLAEGFEMPLRNPSEEPRRSAPSVKRPVEARSEQSDRNDRGDRDDRSDRDNQSTPSTPSSQSSQNIQSSPAQPQSPLASKLKRGLRSHTIRISEAEKEITDNTRVGSRREPFTDEDFANAWAAYQARNPELRILCSAMRGAELKRVDENKFSVLVDHPAAMQAFENDLAHLLGFLRDTLQNDMVAIEVGLNTTAVVQKQLPRAEFLKKIFGENPDLAQFMKDIEAELV